MQACRCSCTRHACNKLTDGDDDSDSSSDIGSNNVSNSDSGNTPHMRLQTDLCIHGLFIKSVHMQASDRQTGLHSHSSTQQLQGDSRADGGTSPNLSLGQRMKKSQASWRPLPLFACPLIIPAPSAAAYPLPQQAKHAAAYPLLQQVKQAASATGAEPHCPVLQRQHPSDDSSQWVSNALYIHNCSFVAREREKGWVTKEVLGAQTARRLQLCACRSCYCLLLCLLHLCLCFGDG